MNLTIITIKMHGYSILLPNNNLKAVQRATT